MSDPSPTAAPHSDPASVSPAAAAMYAADTASQSLGIRLVAVSDGTATVAMEVRDDLVNGLDVCHGGIIFTLADTAMAFASNADGAHALAAQASIDWLAPARAGQTLTATATTIQRQGRTALHDVSVVDEDGVVIALFRGRTRSTVDRLQAP